MAKNKGLGSVSYSRNHQAERLLSTVLIGSSRWLRDIELLLEDDWPNLSNVGLNEPLPKEIASQGVGLALVEASAEVEQVRLCLESSLVPSLEKVLVLREGENAFVKRTYINYAARSGLSILELPDEAKSAAQELSGMLGGLLVRVRNEIEMDIERAELILDGFSMNNSVVPLRYNNWGKRSEIVLSWLFPMVTLSTAEYRLLRFLVRARPLFELRSQWTGSLSETLLPLDSYAQASRLKDFLELTEALIDKAVGSSAVEKSTLSQAISDSKLGPLTKRTLTRELDKLISGHSEISKGRLMA